MRTREHYDHDLVALHNQLNDLSSLVTAAVSKSLKALAHQDFELAAQVVEDDHIINRAQHEVEYQAITLVALQQPVGHDLRSLVATIAAAGELERIGDYARGVAKLVLGPAGSEALQVPDSLLKLGYAANAVLDHALAALATVDGVAARTIAGEEEQIDRLYKQVKHELANSLAGSPAPDRGADLLFIAHNFERIADRATNIAERAIYAASAELVELNP